MKILSLLLLLFITQSVWAASLSIPQKSTTHAPATDLIDDGKPIDRDQVFQKIISGEDVSLLDPSESDIWKKKATGFVDHQFPKLGTAFKFNAFKSQIIGMFRASVDGEVAGENRPFTLVMGLDSHSALLRAKMLERLGFQMVGPKFYPTLKIIFSSTQERELFLDNVSDATLTSRNRWIKEMKDGSSELIVQDVLLEPARVNYQQYYWGAMNQAHLNGRRVLRSLIVPFVLADIGESINLYSWELGKIVSKSIVLTHPYADKFSETTFDDARWMVRKVAKLSKADFKEIVDYANYPEDVAAVLLNKLISRRNHLIKLFKLKREFKDLDFEKKGKITKEFYDGYAIRFTYGDPDSPLRASELSRFLLVKSIGTVMKNVETFFNSLASYEVSEGVAKHQQKLYERFIKAIMKGEQAQMPIKAWVTPIGGVNLSTSRDVVSGTYYGSSSPVQLVDSFSLSANVGLFMGFDSIPFVSPGVTGNVSVGRSYVHVRPILDMKTALKSDWKALLVKSQMNELAKILEFDLSCEGDNCQQIISERLEGVLGDFATNFNTGEMFIVADSINLNGAAQLSMPLFFLGPIGQFMRTNVGGGGSHVITQKITLERTESGVDIYVQKMNDSGANLSFNFSFFINLYGTQAKRKNGDVKTKFYHIPIKDVKPSQQAKTVLVLKSIFKKGKTELLEDNFYPYDLDHKLNGKIKNRKLMLWHWDNLSMDHQLQILPPLSLEHDYDRTKFGRTLYRKKEVKRRGTSFLKFIGETIGSLQKWVSFNSGRPGEDVANSFLGKGFKEIFTTEAEITEGKKYDPVTIFESVWSGWSISRKKLFKIVGKLEDRLQSLNLDRTLISRDAFNDTKQIQLYELRSTMIIYKEAIDKIMDIAFNMSELKAYNALVYMYGEQAFKDDCDKLIDFFGDEGPQKYSGQRVYQCVPPWVQKFLNLKKRGMPQDKKELVDITNSLVSNLFTNVGWDKVIKYLGDDNLFFITKVSGFRTHDENEDAEYLSDTIGVFGARQGSGVFRDFSTNYGISSYELNASFFSEGI